MTAPSCPRCGRRVAATDFDLALRLARCEACGGESFRFETADPAFPSAPKGADAHAFEPFRTLVGPSSLNPILALQIPFLCIFNAFACSFMPIGARAGSFVLVPLLMLTGGTVWLLAIIVSLTSRRSVSLDLDNIVVAVGPFGLIKTMIPIAGVREIYASESIVVVTGRHGVHQIHAGHAAAAGLAAELRFSLRRARGG